MKSGIGFSEILLILALILIFISPKQVPGLIRKSLRIVSQLRSGFRKFFDDINK